MGFQEHALPLRTITRAACDPDLGVAAVKWRDLFKCLHTAVGLCPESGLLDGGFIVRDLLSYRAQKDAARTPACPGDTLVLLWIFPRKIIQPWRVQGHSAWNDEVQLCPGGELCHGWKIKSSEARGASSHVSDLCVKFSHEMTCSPAPERPEIQINSNLAQDPI